jgi:hypothetical protein
MTDKEISEQEDEIESPGEDSEKPSPEESEFIEEEWIGEEDWGEEEDDELLLEEEAPSYVDNSDGTISDARNHLMWKKSDSYSDFGYGITWYEAHDYCESMNEKKFAGFDDWRLANFEEAKSLFSFTNSNRDKDGAEIHIDSLFEPDGGHNTWTYEEKPDYSQYAMKFSYVTGNEMWENKENEYSHVRIVRDVAKDEWEPEWRDSTKKFER